MSLSQPSAPDPFTSAAIQSQFNGSQAVNNSVMNNVQQNTPYGNLTYTPTETALGVPFWTASQYLNAPTQSLLNQYQGTQQQLGGMAPGLAKTANNMAGNAAGMYSQPPNFMSTSSPQVQQMMGAFNSYMAPTYAMQESNLDSKLANQGLGQGGQAWTNAQRGQMGAEDQAAQSALMNFEPQAFNQAVTQYQAPMNTMASLFNMGTGLMGAGAPGGGSVPGLINPPQSGNAQPGNYQLAAQNQFNAQQQQFQNTVGGLSTLGSGLISGLGLGGPGGLLGLFGGGGIDPFPGGTFNPLG